MCDSFLMSFSGLYGDNAMSIKVFKIWKSIIIGNSLTAKKFLKIFKGKIGDWASYIFGKVEFSKQETRLNLVRLSVADLGFPNGATYEKICARAQELGLKLCPAEVGPQLRLQYPDQPSDEWLRIAMEPMKTLEGYLRLFTLGCGVDKDSTQWLSGRCGAVDFPWNSDEQFVFVSGE